MAKATEGAMQVALSREEADTVVKSLDILKGSLEGLVKRASAVGEEKAAKAVAETQARVEALKTKFL